MSAQDGRLAAHVPIACGPFASLERKASRLHKVQRGAIVLTVSSARKSDEEAVRLHALYHGKMQVVPKCPIRDAGDFSVWYTPGVAAPCRAIHADPAAVYEFTNKANSIAIVSDGSRVLGLGNIGPYAGLPVMEGKALLFKYLGGVDAVAICLATQDERELVRTVQFLEPSFGAINLEDIAPPRCFRVLEELRKTMKIPVWHDDQQGSATAVLAGLIGALTVTGKTIGSIRVAMIGMGAANFATYRLLKAYGLKPEQVVACDSQGILNRGRIDIERRQTDLREKWSVCQETNPKGITGGIQQALRGADVCIAFARPFPGLIDPAWVRAMARDAIVFACANPAPEIWPIEAKQAGARVVATGRSDLPNQLNNSLVFPGIFRGTLDARASSITDEMALAAAMELARCAEERGLREDAILPTMADWEVVPRVAAATAMKAQELGLAHVAQTREQYIDNATRRILAARRLSQIAVEEATMPTRLLKEFLDRHKIKYVTMTHSTAYTAAEIASLAHVRGDEFAKTVIVRIDGDLVMAVLPASHHVDLPLFKDAAHGKKIALAAETDFRDKFPGCEEGAMPPFGPLYGMRVFVDETLTLQKEIAFNAGTHHELIRLSYADFERLAQPKVAQFSTIEETALRL